MYISTLKWILLQLVFCEHKQHLGEFNAFRERILLCILAKTYEVVDAISLTITVLFIFTAHFIMSFDFGIS